MFEMEHVAISTIHRGLDRTTGFIGARLQDRTQIAHY
jgi:hypothetical protein